MAAKELHVDIVGPAGSQYSGEATMVRVRTSEGEIGILPGHTPMLGVLREGELLVQNGSSRDLFHATGGFVSVEGASGRVTIVADNIEAREAGRPAAASH